MFKKVEIIAEAGVNHNGSLKMAFELVDVAAEAKADYVKFQTFKSEKVVSKFAAKAAYQKETTGEQESQLEMVKKLELSEKDHLLLQEHCNKRGIQFLSTPFDKDSLHFLNQEMKLEKIKLASGEIVNAPLLYAAANTRKPLILSTGMSTLGEIEEALSVLAFCYVNKDRKQMINSKNMRAAFSSEEGQAELKKYVTLLHCTTEYPAPFEDVNLRAMQTMSSAFGLAVGYSDHTPGIHISLAAVALGACVIEKHFTLDQNLPGPDHKASLTPTELYQLVKQTREISLALGDGRKIPQASELKNIAIGRRSIVAAKTIQKNETFTDENLELKRPGTGMSPFQYWSLLGKKADKDYDEDEEIKCL